MRPRHLAALHLLAALALAAPAAAMHAGRRCITCERVADAAAPRAADARVVRRGVPRRAEAAAPRYTGCPAAAARAPR